VSAPPAGLRGVLGPLDGAGLVIGNVVGVGIFVVPGVVASQVHQPALALLLWCAGAALAFAGASAYGELAARLPRAGGEYVYLREAFGPLAGFLSGWTSLLAGFSGAIAASAVGLMIYLGRLAPALSDDRAWAALPLGVVTLTISPQRLGALLALFAFAALQARGVRTGVRATNVLVVTQLLVFAALIVGLARGAPVASGAAVPNVTMVAWLSMLVPVMFTYSGWNAAAYLAEEFREPARDVPRALLFGTMAVGVVYVAMNAVLLYAAPPAARELVTAGASTTEGLLGPVAGILATLAITLAIATGLGAMIAAGPRVYLAMARDGALPAAVARVDAARGTPSGANLLQAGWSGLLILSGGFEALIRYTGFSVVLFSGLAVAALFVLRARAGAPPVRAVGYPWLPMLFVLASLVLVVASVVHDPLPSLAGLAVVATGVPIYLITSARARAGWPQAAALPDEMR